MPLALTGCCSALTPQSMGRRTIRAIPPMLKVRRLITAGLISLVGQLDAEAARKVMGDNARRLFKLNGNSH